ncbi:MAG: hypothetical protein GY794_03060 [bacterium]|nr:hypothetical protein [bacterium]
MTDHTDKDRPETEGALEGVDPEKRRTLTKLAASAFVAPVVASFPMDGLTISRAHAETASASGLVKEKKRRRRRHGHGNGGYFPNSTVQQF